MITNTVQETYRTEEQARESAEFLQKAGVRVIRVDRLWRGGWLVEYQGFRAMSEGRE